MLKKSDFVSKSNYYIVYVFDKVFWLICKLYDLLKSKAPRITAKNRVIFLDYGHLGDALLLTPAIRTVRQEEEKAEIYCFVSISGAIALKNNPYVKNIVIIDLPWHGDSVDIFKSIKGFIDLVRLIRNVNAKIIINFRSTRYHIEHIAMWIAGVPKRIGFSHKGLGYLLTNELYGLKNRLIAGQKVDLVDKWLGITHTRASLKPDYFTNSKAQIKGKNIFKGLKIGRLKIIIGINASAQHNFLWPEKYFVELCRLLLINPQYELLFLGTDNFIEYYNRINDCLSQRVKSLAGKTTIDELAVILKNLDLLVTVDTGMRHMANAIDTPVISLKHGANNVYEFSEYVKNEKVIFQRVPCSPCGRELCPLHSIKCMTKIAPESVFAQIKTFFDDAK